MHNVRTLINDDLMSRIPQHATSEMMVGYTTIRLLYPAVTSEDIC